MTASDQFLPNEIDLDQMDVANWPLFRFVREQMRLGVKFGYGLTSAITIAWLIEKDRRHNLSQVLHYGA